MRDAVYCIYDAYANGGVGDAQVVTLLHLKSMDEQARNLKKFCISSIEYKLKFIFDAAAQSPV